MSGKKYYYPNIWGRLIFLSAEEVIGKQDVATLLNMAKMSRYIDNYPPDDARKEISFEEVGGFFRALYDVYGQERAQAVGRMAGRRSFEEGVKKFKGVSTAASTLLKVGSLDDRVRVGIDFLGKFIATSSDQLVETGEDDDHWIYRVPRCPICWQWTAPEPVCFLIGGTLEAAFAWVSGDKKFNIVETECIATGDDACVFQIDKKPID